MITNMLQNSARLRDVVVDIFGSPALRKSHSEELFTSRQLNHDLLEGRREPKAEFFRKALIEGRVSMQQLSERNARTRGHGSHRQRRASSWSRKNRGAAPQGNGANFASTADLLELQKLFLASIGNINLSELNMA